jgi:hypothetical protein
MNLPVLLQNVTSFRQSLVTTQKVKEFQKSNADFRKILYMFERQFSLGQYVDRVILCLPFTNRHLRVKIPLQF